MDSQPDSLLHICLVITGIHGVILTMAHPGTGAQTLGIILLRYGGTHGTGMIRGTTVHGIGDVRDTTGDIMIHGTTTDGTTILGVIRCTTITTIRTMVISTEAATDGITETGHTPKPPDRITEP